MSMGVTSILYPLTLEWIGFSGTFLGYTTMAALIVTFSYFTLPEFKEKSLVTIEESLDKPHL